jgi:hypothetical protein
MNLLAWSKTHLVPILFGLLLLMELGTAFVSVPTTTVGREITQGTDSAPVRISEITDARIDSVAATVVMAPALPQILWVLLLVAYVTLLVFNWSYTFRTVTSPQWRFELILTLLTLGAWYHLDSGRGEIWFPLTLIKSGLIVAIIYVYLLERRSPWVEPGQK